MFLLRREADEQVPAFRDRAGTAQPRIDPFRGLVPVLLGAVEEGLEFEAPGRRTAN